MARDRPLAALLHVVRGWFPLDGLEAERGQGMVEYALILSLVAIICISLLFTIGKPITTFLSQMGTSI